MGRMTAGQPTLTVGFSLAQILHESSVDLDLRKDMALRSSTFLLIRFKPTLYCGTLIRMFFTRYERGCYDHVYKY